MNDLKILPDHQRLSAIQLRKLPPDERAVILEAQAALVEEHYRHDPKLTAFEAFAEVDLHADSSSPATGEVWLGRPAMTQVVEPGLISAFRMSREL